jgi:hypothetical protein
MLASRCTGTLVFFTLALDLSGCTSPPKMTIAEQEIIEALLSQATASKPSQRYVIRETASTKELWLDYHDRGKFTQYLRDEARNCDAAFREALEDFLHKNSADTKIVFPVAPSKTIELVSETMAGKFIKARSDGKPGHWRWDWFYRRYPDSGGLITISRVGIDSKTTIAIVYLGWSSDYLAGFGAIRILRHEGNHWVLTHERFGPSWVS